MINYPRLGFALSGIGTTALLKHTLGSKAVDLITSCALGVFGKELCDSFPLKKKLFRRISPICFGDVPLLVATQLGVDRSLPTFLKAAFKGYSFFGLGFIFWSYLKVEDPSLEDLEEEMAPRFDSSNFISKEISEAFKAFSFISFGMGSIFFQSSFAQILSGSLMGFFGASILGGRIGDRVQTYVNAHEEGLIPFTMQNMKEILLMFMTVAAPVALLPLSKRIEALKEQILIVGPILGAFLGFSSAVKKEDEEKQTYPKEDRRALSQIARASHTTLLSIWALYQIINLKEPLQIATKLITAFSTSWLLFFLEKKETFPFGEKLRYYRHIDETFLGINAFCLSQMIELTPSSGALASFFSSALFGHAIGIGLFKDAMATPTQDRIKPALFFCYELIQNQI